jgi:hypothetical protein
MPRLSRTFSGVRAQGFTQDIAFNYAYLGTGFGFDNRKRMINVRCRYG